MNSIGTTLDKKFVQDINANHPGRAIVSGAEGFIVSVGFFAVIVVAEFGSVSCKLFVGGEIEESAYTAPSSNAPSHSSRPR
jgi:hypothetical protein